MSSNISNYYDLDLAARHVEEGTHRGFVGGLWDEVGKLQFDYVANQGLSRDAKVLDIGCGCLRGGVHFIDYLDPGNYFGIDISESLLNAGFDTEVTALNLQHKLPRENLFCNSEFDASSFGIAFDVLIAQSVFTHLPWNHIKLCLTRAATYTRVDGLFYATFFLCDDGVDWTEPQPIVGEIFSKPTSDPYHYTAQDLKSLVKELPWSVDVVGDWQHPRKQSMVVFRRLAE